MAVWTPDEAIALSLGKNPSSVNWHSLSGGGESYVRASLLRSPFRLEYARRHELVRRALLANDITDPIRPEVFLSWAARTFDTVSPELLEQVRKRENKVDDIRKLTERITELETELSSRKLLTSSKWPWGTHETDSLVLLAAAAQKHWVLYDPGDPTTAPKNNDVVAWLKERGASQNIASAIASILRPKDIATGPRK